MLETLFSSFLKFSLCLSKMHVILLSRMSPSDQKRNIDLADCSCTAFNPTKMVYWHFNQHMTAVQLLLLPISCLLQYKLRLHLTIDAFESFMLDLGYYIIKSSKVCFSFFLKKVHDFGMIFMQLVLIFLEGFLMHLLQCCHEKRFTCIQDLYQNLHLP